MRLGTWSARRPWWVIGLWVGAILVVLGASIAWGESPTQTITIPGAPSGAVLEELQAKFPDQAGGRAIVVFGAADGHRVDDPPERDAIEETLARVASLHHVRTVISPTGPAAPLLQSPAARVAWAQVVFDVEAFEVPQEVVDQLVGTGTSAEEAGLEVGFGGQVVERVQPESTRTGELIGLAVAMMVLAVAFGTLGATSVPLILAAVVVIMGVASTRLLAPITEVNLVAPAMASMIGLAVGIDYALFVVTRFRQSRQEGLGVRDAAGRASDTAGRSVIFAGGTVMLSMMGLIAVGMPAVTTLAIAVASTVAFAILASLTLLPAMLGAFGHHLDSLRLPLVGTRSDTQKSPPPLSTRWARAVTRRPLPALMLGGGVLALLALPYFSLHTGWPDARHRAPHDPAAVAFRLMTEGFGVGANSPLMVSIASGDAAEVASVHDWLASLPGVRTLTPAIPNAAGDMAVVQVTPQTGPEEQATAELVERIRGSEGRAGPTPRVGVTGATAFLVDLDHRMASRLAWFVAAVVASSLVLLTLVFRAPLVALKAAAMNVLGIAAAYGVVVAVFQWGWGIGLLGLDRPVPVVSSLPIVMFAVLFGLSMDYEVFILSRVRESWSSGRDNTSAVIDGLSASSRVVTAAAVIMFAVFAGFATADGIEIKMTGFGLAVAVLLDATVIRQVLVPATMTLLGERNWWIPAWLDRLLPDIDVDGGQGGGGVPGSSPGPDLQEPITLPKPAVATADTVTV